MITKTSKVLLGQEVFYYVLTNDYMRITFMDLGATIVNWEVKNTEGDFESIVLRYEHDEDYLKNPKFLGATVGPYAGRIYPAEINLDNKTYKLAKNFNDKANLHSDTLNLMHHKYLVSIIDEDTLSFKTSLDTEFYPSDSTYTLTFSLKEDTLHQVYETFSNKDTFTNLTNHTYFNLSGDIKRDILDHTLIIKASKVGNLNQDFISESLMDVEKTVFDFNQEKPLKDAIIPLKKTHQLGLDHPFMLDDQTIVLKDKESKRTLSIKTNNECVVVYSNNFLIEEPLAGGMKDRSHLSICLETQHYPNDIHFFDYPKSFHAKNTSHQQVTTYKVTNDD
jgi:aldose 1-epimerase